MASSASCPPGSPSNASTSVLWRLLDRQCGHFLLRQHLQQEFCSHSFLPLWVLQNVGTQQASAK